MSTGWSGKAHGRFVRRQFRQRDVHGGFPGAVVENGHSEAVIRARRTVRRLAFASISRRRRRRGDEREVTKDPLMRHGRRGPSMLRPIVPLNEPVKRKRDFVPEKTCAGKMASFPNSIFHLKLRMYFA